MKNNKSGSLKVDQVESLKEGVHKPIVLKPINEVKKLEFNSLSDFRKDLERYNFFLENRKKRSNSQLPTKLELISEFDLNQVPYDLIVEVEDEDEISTSPNLSFNKFSVHK